MFDPNLQAIQSMQEKGLESDPRYSTLLSFARNAQQMQQMPGFSNNANTNLMGNMVPTPGQQALNSGNEGFSNEEHSAMQGNPGKNAGFSGDQINQLRSQIMAYKLLSRNQPLTEQIKMTIQSKGATSRMPNMHPSTADRTGTVHVIIHLLLTTVISISNSMVFTAIWKKHARVRFPTTIKMSEG
jgi:hypothetical protein